MKKIKMFEKSTCFYTKITKRNVWAGNPCRDNYLSINRLKTFNGTLVLYLQFLRRSKLTKNYEEENRLAFRVV